VFEEVKGKMYNGAREIVNNRMAILQEVAFLKKQGVEFTTPEFRDLAGKVEQLVADYAEQDKRKISAVFVRFKKVGDDTYVDVQEVMNVREIRWDVKMNTTSSLSTTYPLNELPQDIAEQVSVLSILENDGYVSNVGMKIDDITFWVERG
jgi:DNA polymerase/3'-5' exonuclease PolX